jgi:hypothetical protein
MPRSRSAWPKAEGRTSRLGARPLALRCGLLLPFPPQPRLRRHSRSRAPLRTVLGGDGVQDRSELKGFLIPQKRSPVGLLADRHWRTVCPTLALGLPMGGHFADVDRRSRYR